MNTRPWVPVVLSALLTAGCSPKVPPAPKVDASAAVEQIMAEYDANRDGFLDAQELARVPSLGRCLARWDKNGDGKLSKAEMEEGLAAFLDSGIGLSTVSCKVTLNERPLEGASVVFEPEPFLKGVVKPAKGTTDAKGRARMQVEGVSIPGCQLGLYRVRISKTDMGQEVVPARYNAQTQLGTAVLPADRGSHAFHLSSP
jgi:hypothetical protein